MNVGSLERTIQMLKSLVKYRDNIQFSDFHVICAARIFNFPLLALQYVQYMSLTFTVISGKYRNDLTSRPKRAIFINLMSSEIFMLLP